MDSIILIFVCLFAGLGLRFIKNVPANAHVALNQFVIYISLPAVSLYYVPKIILATNLLYAVAVAYAGFLLSWVFFGGLGKILNWPQKLTGCLILCAGLGNTSFVGFPVIEALYGKQGLEIALMVDQPGSFVVVSTLGIFIALTYSNSKSDTPVLKKMLLFPPLIGFMAGLALNLLHLDFPETVQPVLQKLGSTVTPVALVAVGLQLKFERKSRYWNFMWLGLLFKIILTPLFFYILYKLIIHDETLTTTVSVLEAAMPPMITAAILCSAYNLKPKLAGMMIGIGIPLSFITLAVWHFILTNS